MVSDLDLVRAGIKRVISKRRKRVLAKRGELIRYSPELNSYYWEPFWQSPNPKTDSGLPWISHPELMQLNKQE